MWKKFLAFVCLVGRYFAPNQKPFCVLIGLLVAAAIVEIGYFAHPYNTAEDVYAVSVLVAGCGVGFGFLAGSFASPGETSERTMFKVIAGLVLTFATGFVLKEFGVQIKTVDLHVLLNSARFWMFVASLLGGAISVYVYRAYYSSPSKSKQEIIEKATKDLTRIQGELATLAAKETPSQVLHGG